MSKSLSKSSGALVLFGRLRLGLVLLLGALLVLLAGLAVSAQAETAPPGTPVSATESVGGIRAHTNAGFAGATAGPFTVTCNGCHTTHDATSAHLLPAEGAGVCAACHDLNGIHADPSTQQAVAASPAPGDCVSCHSHSSGFMPVSGAASLTLSKQTVGYEDLDSSGDLSPADRVHYRIDYGNPGPQGVTGALLRDSLDTAHVASVDAITGGGAFDGTAIQWDIGMLAAGANGSVTYDVVLQDALAFGGNATTTSTTAPPATDSTTTTVSSTTTSTTLPAGSVDVVNMAALTADNRAPLSASVVVSVVLAGSQSATTTTALVPESTTTTEGATTTTSLTTTSATILVAPADVINTAVLTADNREPVSMLAVNSRVVQSLSSTEPETASTAESPTVAAGASALTLSNRAADYEDLDGDGKPSPGDRVYYRIDYGNPGSEPATGALLRAELDTAHVASVEGIGDDGTLEETAAVIATAVRWNLGTLAAGASGFVTYAVVLRDAPAMVRDGWFFPVQGPNSYSDDFGAPRYAGGYHPHEGNDILCARGTPLVAVVGGIIGHINPVDTGLGGINIWLDGDDGNSYYYAHLCAIQDGIASGERVAAGQVIGFAGDTGDAKGGPVHLHFSIHPRGGPAVDPYLVLKGVLLVSEVPRTTPDTTTTTTTDTTVTTDTTTTTPPVTDTTTTSEPPASDTTTTTDTTTTNTTPLASDTTTTSTPPVTDTTTTTAPPGSATIPVPVPAAAAFLTPVGSIVRRLSSIRRRRR